MSTAVSFLLFALLGSGHCSYYLKHLSYTKLPATFTAPDTKTYKMFSGTAEEAAYDHINKLLYVVGETSSLLHVLDISDPTSPRSVLTHVFNADTDGKPRDVAVCGNEVAVSLSSPVTDVHEGHIYFYNALTRDGTQLIKAEPKIVVGAMPDMITFTSNCDSLIVANEGSPGKAYSKSFYDPEGTINIISRQRTGNPTSRLVEFSQFNHRHDIRTPGKFTTNGNYHPSVAQCLEPEYITISSDDRTAYITLQENDAIATLSLSTGVITQLVPLEKKYWKGLGIDISNRDGGVHLRDYPFKSIRQPDVAKSIKIGGKDFVITVDEGATSSFTSRDHGFVWNDFIKADVLQKGNHFDPIAINNITFYTDLGIDTKAGYLTVSLIDDIDIYNHNNNKLQGVTHFGGRGISIWDASDFSLVWDSGDEIEREMDVLMHNVFNTDCLLTNITYYGPENDRDYASSYQGPKLNAMDVLLQHDGDNLLLVGSETVGALFLYTLNTTSGKPVPKFQSAHRQGKTEDPWKTMYDNGVVGDVHISAIGLIPASDTDPAFNRTLAYVVGAVSGSVSLYEIVQHVDPDEIFG